MELAKKLHPLERKIIGVLKGEFSVSALEQLSGLKEVEVVRAAQWLQNKGLALIKEDPKEVINLDTNGKKYVSEGLPEKRFLLALDKERTLDDVGKLTGLSREELGVSMGILKQKAAISTTKDKVLLVKRTQQGNNLANKEWLEEVFLKKNYPINAESLSPEEKFAFDNLKKRRNIIREETIKNRTIGITPLGIKVQGASVDSEKTIESITPAILRDGSWKDKEFRAYDVAINVPKIFSGKAQPYADFIHQARRKLALMGFEEMTGPMIELEFYNFDALYQPQNHPARTWTATYNIKGKGKLPDKKLVSAVKAAHEHGGKTNSTGWGGSWNPEIAARLVPRAHDTAISPRYLSKRVNIPGKYYSIVRCFRPDVIDATHAVEFNQLGGFVVGDGLSFTHLLGLLKEFAKEMTGAKEFKFVPDYFPFTEPSVQISAKTEWGWMELCGAGVFRPEMTQALGIKEPVIAWGFGIDRLAMLKLGINDIRDLFTQNLKNLRASKKVVL